MTDIVGDAMAGFSKGFINDILYGLGRRQRFTQDSPIRPDAWIAFGQNPGERVELLLEAHIKSTPSELYRQLRHSLGSAYSPEMRLAYNQSSVVGRFTLRETLLHILPLTGWYWSWLKELNNESNNSKTKDLKEFITGLDGSAIENKPQAFTVIFATLIFGENNKIPEELTKDKERKHITPDEISDIVVQGLIDFYDSGEAEKFFKPKSTSPSQAPLWAISQNRTAELAVRKSGCTIKADAAIRVFNVDCSDITWAVVDSGIDARHPAFHVNPQAAIGLEKIELKDSRVIATYDFTRIHDILSRPEVVKDFLGDAAEEGLTGAEISQQIKEMLSASRAIDWHLLRPALEVRRESYKPPSEDNKHGTHVAGILGGKWLGKNETGESPAYGPEDDGSGGNALDKTITGICPSIRLIDVRVFKDDGRSDEFTILCALQFLRHLNSRTDVQVLHGINLSLSLRHDVKHFACGRTPICIEAERAVNDGICVVAAAGNGGYHTFLDHNGDGIEQYSDISITDPGNAEAVITVGATHRTEPHTYGVSYFSSRGPTGDGRSKPDLVAPGEKIRAPIPGAKSEYMDGTSMAAPHVSGAAALLMARHRELVGQPRRIKEILCNTATDLGRERKFQGRGLVDVLRALQSV